MKLLEEVGLPDDILITILQYLFSDLLFCELDISDKALENKILPPYCIVPSSPSSMQLYLVKLRVKLIYYRLPLFGLDTLAFDFLAW